MAMRTVSIQLSDEQIRDIDEVAKQLQLTRSAVVRTWIRRKLAEEKPSEMNQQDPTSSS